MNPRWIYCIAVGMVITLTNTQVLRASEQAAAVLHDSEIAQMIASCFDYAAQNKLPPISIAIVDETGALLSFQRQLGAAPTTAEVALLKARSSARTRVPTSALATQDAAARDLFVLLRLTPVAGGLPLLRGEQLLAAVGVSGSLPAEDAACALRAVTAVGGGAGKEK